MVVKSRRTYIKQNRKKIVRSVKKGGVWAFNYPQNPFSQFEDPANIGNPYPTGGNDYLITEKNRKAFFRVCNDQPGGIDKITDKEVREKCQKEMKSIQDKNLNELFDIDEDDYEADIPQLRPLPPKYIPPPPNYIPLPPPKRSAGARKNLRHKSRKTRRNRK